MYYNKAGQKGDAMMQITNLSIKNFKSIRNMVITDIENALILVGKNNAGKSSVLHAIRAVEGSYKITLTDFNESMQNIEIGISLSVTEEDLHLLHKNGVVSQYKKYSLWEKEFYGRLPSLQDHVLSFTFIANKEGNIRFDDGYKKNNKYIPLIFPSIYFLGTDRNLQQIQDDLLMMQEDSLLKIMRTNCCMFSEAKPCNHCFSCIGLINKKMPEHLNAFEAAKLFEFKLYQLNIDRFEKRVNESFHKNGGYEDIIFSMNYDVNQMLQVNADAYNRERDLMIPVERLGRGMKSIYMLSILEAYINDENRLPSILLMEEPEMFLHPKLQKISSEILYRLSQKNQVIFTTHSPNLLPNFNSRQIRQIILDSDYYSVARDKTDLSAILDDLGYTATDLMNVNFVFIVEGKQDKNRLPLLLEQYYSEAYDENNTLGRVAIITTNSCTNIKTYANLKYMNQIYIKDQFLMIRDGDGKDPDELGRQLCRYYDERNLSDIDHLPKVTRRNVLILKYYSFENYFLNPSVMKKLGIIESEHAFYEILYEKWKEYLYKLKSGKHLIEILGRDFSSLEDMKEHMEEIKIYLRGHNLYDIFYGPYKNKEKELLKEYISIAPRDDFKDILDAIDHFIYFQSKKKL